MTKQKTNVAAALLAKRGEIAEQIEALKTDAGVLRKRIAALRTRRDEIANRPLSKSAYIEMVCAWIDRKADECQAKLAAQLLRHNDFGLSRGANMPTISRIDQIHEPGRFPGILTMGNPASPDAVKEESMFLFLRNSMKAELEKMAENITWPFADAIEDVSAARAEIDSLTAEIEELHGELAGLVELGASFGATI